jgi:hypothetical protein
VLDKRQTSYDKPERGYYPVDEVGWILSESKGRISKNMYGKCSFVCWRREPKELSEDWIRIGPTNVICNYMDNKLCIMVFPFIFATIFKNVLCYSGFIMLKDKVMDWRIRKMDIDNYIINEMWKEFIGNCFLAEDGIDFELYDSIVGREKQRCLQFIPCCIGGDRKEAMEWSERIRNIQLRYKEEGHRMRNQVLDFEWKQKPFLPWDIDGCFAEVVMLENGVERIARSHDSWELDWSYFFDEIGLETSEIDVVKLNRLKKLYGYPDDWDPDRLINYCVTMCIKPINFPWSRRIKRNSVGKLIPYDEECEEMDIGSFLSEYGPDVIRANNG